MKIFIACTLIFASFSSYACNDVMADDLVLNRAMEMAKRYNAKKVGIGTSLLWGDTRITSISILDGEGGDRIGNILINMNTCVVKGKIIGIFDTFRVK
jgi:hypothetical protein